MLVKIITKRRRLCFIAMFMLTCCYNCARSIQSGLRDEESKEAVAHPSPSPRKRRWRIARRSFHPRCHHHTAPPGFSHILPPPPMSPSASRSIIISPRDRKGRGQSSSTSFSGEKETKDRVTSLFLARLFSQFSPFLSYCLFGVKPSF